MSLVVGGSARLGLPAAQRSLSPILIPVSVHASRRHAPRPVRLRTAATSSEPGMADGRRLAATSGARTDRRRVLTRQQAREVYDENGKKDLVKDSESIYGGPATEALLSNAAFASANLVFEFGHGSGRLAQRLLSSVLPEGCQYVGVDQSRVMNSLATQRLHGFGDRVQLRHAPDGNPATCADGVTADGTVDVFVSTYVLDLLSEDDCDAVLELAARLLRPGGQLCLSGLTFGRRVGVLPSLTTMVWEAVHLLRPTVVGGCRAQNLEDYLGPLWKVQSSTLVSGGYLSSEVLICVKRPTGGEDRTPEEM